MLNDFSQKKGLSKGISLNGPGPAYLQLKKPAPPAKPAPKPTSETRPGDVRIPLGGYNPSLVGMTPQSKALTNKLA